MVNLVIVHTLAGYSLKYSDSCGYGESGYSHKYGDYGDSGRFDILVNLVNLVNSMILVNLKMLRNGNSDEFDESSKYGNSGGSDDSGESFDTNAYFHFGDFNVLENLINVLSLGMLVKNSLIW